MKNGGDFRRGIYMQKIVAKEKEGEREEAVSLAVASAGEAVVRPAPSVEESSYEGAVPAGKTKKIVFAAKRIFDVLFSVFCIVLFAIPMLAISIAIKADSKGPVVFKSKRMGKNLKPFYCYKFRSMRTDAPKDCATRLLNSEEYLTKVGRFIRRTSLDELPQFFCILFGTMSFVGPRPVVLTETELIEERRIRGAYNVLPGLTGLAQINGRDTLGDHTKAEYDGIYAEKITLWGDIKIIFITIIKVFKGEDIVEGSQSSRSDKKSSKKK